MKPSDDRQVIWSGWIASDRRNGTGYNVAIYSDGRGSCSCMAFIMRGPNRGNPDYRCKHIERQLVAVANQLRAERGGLSIETAIERGGIPKEAASEIVQRAADEISSDPDPSATPRWTQVEGQPTFEVEPGPRIKPGPRIMRKRKSTPEPDEPAPADQEYIPVRQPEEFEL